MAREVKVAFVGDTSSLRRALKTVEQDTATLGGKLRSIGSNVASAMGTIARSVAVAGGAAAAGLVALGAASIKSASDLNESLNKSNAVFRESARDIELWSRTAAESFGQSQQQALDAAATFGNLFVQLGVGSRDAAELSKQMVELASDFASFHNAAPVDVIDAMTAAFRGEYDAVQRYVPTINAAAVEQRALAMTGKATTDALTEQDKALAVQALLYEGAGDAMGDFDRTSDSLANRQRTLAAQFDNLRAMLGSMLLPVMSSVMSFIMGTVVPGFRALFDAVRNGDVTSDGFIGAMERIGVVIRNTVIPFVMSVVDTIRNNWPEIRDTAEDVFTRVVAVLNTAIRVLRNVGRFILENKDAFIVAAGAVTGFVVAFRAINGVISIVKAFQASFAALNAVMAANPIVLVAAAIAALVAAVVIAYQRFEPFRNLVDAVGRALRDGFGAAMEWITTTVLPPLRAAIETFVSIVTALWQRFGDNILSFVRTTWDNIKLVINGVLNVIRGIINAVLGILTGDWSRAWDGIKQIVTGAWNIIKGIVGQAINAVKTAIGIGLDAAKGLFTTAWEGIKSLTKRVIDGIVGFFRDLPGRIGGLAGSIGSAALNIGSTIIRKIIEGISGFAGFVADVGRAIVNSAINFVNTQIIDRVNDALEVKISVPGPLPDINLNPPDIPHIPRLARGGLVMGPTLALVGEAGPELVVPLDMLRPPAPVPANVYITINMPPGSDGEDVVNALRRYQRRNGPIPIKVA